MEPAGNRAFAPPPLVAAATLELASSATERVGWGFIASAAPWGWLGWMTPGLLLVLFFTITGIPPTEEQALRSRGEDYRRYQQETSIFVPWFPKRS